MALCAVLSLRARQVFNIRVGMRVFNRGSNSSGETATFYQPPRTMLDLHAYRTKHEQTAPLDNPEVNIALSSCIS